MFNVKHLIFKQNYFPILHKHACLHLLSFVLFFCKLQFVNKLFESKKNMVEGDDISWSGLSVSQLIINTKNIEAAAMVQRFLNSLDVTAIAQPVHRAFSSDFIPAQPHVNFSEELNVILDSGRLHILERTLEEDADQESEDMRFMIESRFVFLGFIREFIVHPRRTRKEMISYFKVLHQFRVLLTNPQYGLSRLFNAYVRKLLQLFHSDGIFLFFLFFCEYYPDMLKDDFYPRSGTPSSLQRETAMVREDPMMHELHLRHQHKWNRYLLSQFYTS